MNTTAEVINIKERPNKISFSIQASWNAKSLSSFVEVSNILYQLTVLTTEIIDDSIEYPYSMFNYNFNYNPTWTKLTGFLSRKNYARALLSDIIVLNGKVYHESSLTNYYYSNVNSDRARSMFLGLRSVNYNSPGNIDLFGIGEFVQALFEPLRYYFPNEHDKIEIKIREQELLKLQMENLEKIGLTSEEIAAIILLSKNSNSLLKDMILSKGMISDIKLKN